MKFVKELLFRLFGLWKDIQALESQLESLRKNIPASAVAVEKPYPVTIYSRQDPEYAKVISNTIEKPEFDFFLFASREAHISQLKNVPENERNFIYGKITALEELRQAMRDFKNV